MALVALIAYALAALEPVVAQTAEVPGAGARASSPSPPVCIEPALAAEDLSPVVRPIKLLRLWKPQGNRVPINTQLVMLRGMAQRSMGLDLEPTNGAVLPLDLVLSFLVFESAGDIGAGRYPQAEERLLQCVGLADRARDRPASAACENNLGVVRAIQGRYGEADGHFERSLALYRAWEGNPQEDVRTTTAFTDASEDRSLAAAGVQVSLLNRGNAARAAGNMAASEGHLQLALESAASANPPQCVGAPVADLARLYMSARRPDLAQALQSRNGNHPSRPVGFAAAAVQLGTLPQGGESARPPTTAAHVETMGVGAEAVLRAKQARAAREEAAGRSGPAALVLGALARRAEAAGRQDVEWLAHAHLMRLNAAAGKPGVAVFHGKLAVNLAQATRATYARTSQARQERRNFLRARQEVYVELAQLLLDQDRLVEAEATLKLMREDEGLQFRESGAEVGTLALSPREKAARQRYAESSSRLRSLNTARGLVARHSSFGMASLAADRAMLNDKLTRFATSSFSRWADDIERQDAEALRSQLRQLAGFLHEGLVALMGDDHLVEKVIREMLDDAVGEPRNPGTVARSDLLRRNLGEVPRLRALLRPRLAETRGAGWSMLDRIANGMWEVRPSSPNNAGAPASSAAPNASAASGGGPGPAPVSGRPSAAAPGSSASQSPKASATAPLREASEWPPVWYEMDAVARLWLIERQIDREDGLQARIDEQVHALLATAERQPDSLSLARGAESGSPAAPRTAIAYLLPGNDRLDLLLVDASGRRKWRVPLRAEVLENDLTRFRSQLRDRGTDPRPVAQSLYRVLIAPMASALKDRGVEHLSLAPFGGLRFIPFAALHDGEKWLAQRFSVSLDQGGRLIGSQRAPPSLWRVAAFGAASGGQGLTPLPAVRDELRAIVNEAAVAAPVGGRGRAVGVAPGQIWLDSAFTAESMRTALSRDFHVLHIASHFAFEAGDASNSFLLLGDGSRLSLRDLGGPAFSFDRIDLVTLSACETGLSGDDAFGQEVDGLGALLLNRGARSVLASLWSVDDDGTAMLMAEFYRARVREGLSMPAALRSAQLSLIQAARQGAAAEVPGSPDGRGRPHRAAEPEPLSRPAAPSPPVPMAHPYYWAPFVLMGSGW